jgi:hypothetical protein
MGLWNGLKALGCRLGLIRIVTAGPSVPPKITPRVTSMKDMMTEGRRQANRDLGDLPRELSLSFEQVFKAAGVPSVGKAWTVERVCDLLRRDAAPDGDRAKVRSALLQQLAAENVTVQDLVEDSLSRHRALEDCEKRLLAEVGQRHQTRQQQRAEVERQMAQLQEACRRLQAADEQDQQQMRTWCGRKSVYQKDMRWAIQIVSESPGLEEPADRPCP